MTADLTLLSRGVSQPREGDRFTSSSHGRRDESIRMSNPYSSVRRGGRGEVRGVVVLHCGVSGNGYGTSNFAEVEGYGNNCQGDLEYILTWI